MPKFKWNKRGSRRAVVTMSYARHSLSKLSVEDAVKHTLYFGRHCLNPELIESSLFNSICNDVNLLIKKYKNRRLSS